MDTVPFTIASKPRIKYLGMSLTKKWKISTMKTSNPRRKRLRKTPENGKAYDVS
jgi:hypothetical protein